MRRVVVDGGAGRAAARSTTWSQKVDAAKAGVETLAGEFTQKNRVKLFKQELTSKGRLFFRKPRQDPLGVHGRPIRRC